MTDLLGSQVPKHGRLFWDGLNGRVRLNGTQLVFNVPCFAHPPSFQRHVQSIVDTCVDIRDSVK